MHPAVLLVPVAGVLMGFKGSPDLSGFVRYLVEDLLQVQHKGVVGLCTHINTPLNDALECEDTPPHQNGNNARENPRDLLHARRSLPV